MILVDKVNSPFLNTKCGGEWHWHGARKLTAARDGAAKRLLYEVGYFEKGSDDKPREGLPTFN